MLTNESAWRPENKTREGLLHLWSVMQEVVNQGINNEGVLPGGLNVERRSHKIYLQLKKKSDKEPEDPLTILDWVTLYALATNEENAAGGRGYCAHKRCCRNYPSGFALLHAFYP